MLYFYFDRGGVSVLVLVFLPSGVFFTWLFVLKSRFNRQGCSKVCACKNCSGTWTTVLAMIALKENLTVLLMSVMPVAPVHKQSLAASHASNVLRKFLN